jgi:DNA-binding response OmpR family regulator
MPRPTPPLPAPPAPLAPSAASSGTTAPRAQAPGEPGFELEVSPTLLLVDDNPDTLRIYSNYLSRKGFTIRTASRGSEALAKVETFNPDLIILDAMLPEIHGFEICRQLKSSEHYKHIPILMVSAVYKGWGYHVDVKNIYGADAYLTKPVMLDELTARIREHLDKRSRDQEAAAGEHAEGAVLINVKRLLEEGRALDAAEILQREVEARPYAARLHYALGAAWSRLGDEFKAIAALERAVELDPEYFTALRNLASLYQRKALVHKAVEALSRAALAAPGPEQKEQVKAQLMKLLT